MKRVPILFIITILFLGCSKIDLSTYSEMKSDNLLSNSFSNNELKDLAKIVDFFEDEMCNNFNKNDKTNIKKCYDKFNIRDSISYRGGSYLKFINFKSQEKLYKQLDSSLLYQIWRNTRCYPDSARVIKTLGIRAWDGKYFEFLKKAGKREELFKVYSDNMALVNDIGISNSLLLTHHYKMMNMNDLKIRLLYAVQYLTINEDINFTENSPCL